MGCSASENVYPADGAQMKMGFKDSLKKNGIKLPLTEREIFALTKTWKAISKNMVNAGVTMFLRMFEARQEVRIMFEQFRTTDDMASLFKSSALENHSLIVMNALDEAMNNMDDEEYLIEFLLTTGRSHQRFENFSETVFWAIEEPFITAVKQTLGDKFTTTLERIYRQAIRFILNTLIIGFNQRERGESNTMSNGY